MKKRRRKQHRKPRASEVSVDFGRDQILTGMKVEDDGTLTFFDEHGHIVRPTYVDIGAAYPRPAKSHKVLTRQPSEPGAIQLDPNQALLRFAFVLAVDTNTIEIHGERVSVSMSALVRNIGIEAEQWHASLAPQAAYEFHDASVAPERIGWWEAICRLKAHPDIRGPVAIIVDSELIALAAMNSREMPILEGFYLPGDFELIYGCGDRGTREYITNAAIAYCDRGSAEILNRLKEEGCSGDYSSDSARPHGRYRYWRKGQKS